MHNSSKLKWCLSALLAVFLSAAAVGCTQGAHTHTFSEEWAFDAQNHWHPATCSHDVKEDSGAHVFTTKEVPPSAFTAGYTLHSCVCGYSFSVPAEESSPAESAEYRYNEMEHWHPLLSEDGAPARTPHSFEEKTVAPTCTAAGYTEHRCVCGYWYASDPTDPVPHVCDEERWEHDGQIHWRLCSVCGAPVDPASHELTEKVTPPSCTAGGYTDFSCKDCGYTFRGRLTPASHTFEETLSSDEYEHWRAASCGHVEERADVADHVFSEGGNVCEVCKKVIQPRLAYEASAEGDYYMVTGMGSFKGSEIAIPANYRGKPVREVAPKAFKNAAVTSVTFGENLTKIGSEAFFGTAISALQLPANLETVGPKAFAGTGIENLVLGEAVLEVGQAAFRGCTALQTVTIEGKLTSLPSYAFEGCTRLERVECAGSLTAVGARAFADCSALLSLDLSKCVSLGFSAFGGCTLFAPSSLPSLREAEEFALSGCGVENCELPALLRVADELFFGCEKLKSVVCGAEEVGASAFGDCPALSSVTLSNAVSIGESAFEGCQALTDITLSPSLYRVGADAFSETGLLSEKNGGIYAANVLVGASAGAQTVTVEEGTAGIADEAFRGASLSAVTLSHSVRFIGASAFRECDNLSAIEFTKNVKIVGANAFRKSGLVAVSVPATVEIVGDNAFYDCMKLTQVTVAAKTIGKFAFSYTGVNRSLNDPVKQRPADAKLSSVTISAGVETIGSNAFQYCPITTISLPAGLKEIGKYAFAQTDLSAVTIPSSAVRIGEYAFYGSKLSSAEFEEPQGWRAGSSALVLSAPAKNAEYLKTTYHDIDWVRG